ncbi:MAG: hypothetical protein IIX15_04955 [Clostridia bacterium]|nr:hypothetical protein [Clostridia bacterium]
MSAWDLLNIEVIEAAALLSTLSQNAVKYLQEEIEGGGKWREKSMHMQAMKHFSEALEVMAGNPSVKTMRDWIEFHEQRRGAEWIEQWGQWFYDSITKSVMYALYTSK